MSHPDKPQPSHVSPGGEPAVSGHGHSHWLMWACCVPMAVLVVVLVATGVLGAGFLGAAVICAGLMGLMVFLMMR